MVRGRWDRRQSADERRASQRDRLRSALRDASALHGDSLTVRHVIERAGVGRNAFYEHFSDIEAAQRVAHDEVFGAVRELLAQSVASARTPVEQMRALASAWLLEASRRRGAFIALLCGDPGRLVRTELVRRLAEVGTSAKRAGVVGAVPEPLRLFCLAGAFVESAVHVAEGSSADVSAAIETLVDVTLRVMR